MEPKLIADYACVTGECPMWHPREHLLYWTDIPAGRMFRYDPATGRHDEFYRGDAVGGFTIQADGSLLLFMSKGAVRIWRDGKLRTVIDEIPQERDSRFNDVIADPCGRVFCGTMSSSAHPGRLYRLDTDGTLSGLLEGIGCSNGMGFTPDRRAMYYTDSSKRELYIFDYDKDSGAVTNQRLFVRTPEGEGVPDGLTVDAEGFVWSARWGGGCIVRYAPDAGEERRVSLPCAKVSSLTFGDKDYTGIFVTTAGGDNKAREGPAAGALFRVDLGIRGVPEFASRVCL